MAGVNGFSIRREYADGLPGDSAISFTRDCIELVVAGVGTVRVKSSGCTSIAVDDGSHAQLADIAGQWAFGQWLLYQEVFAFHGVTVARDDQAIAVLGAPRVGTSLVGLALTRRGWRLIADDVCPIDIEAGAAYALSGREGLEIDRAIVDAIRPDEHWADLHAQRNRVQVEVPSTDRTRINRIIILTMSNTVEQGSISTDESVQGARQLQVNCVAGLARLAGDRQLDQRLEHFCRELATLTEVDVAVVPVGGVVRSYSPKQIAELIIDHLAASAS